MQARKLLSMVLALALVLSVIAPCINPVEATPQVKIYGDNLEQVTAPVVGESYYLGADVAGTMYYFSHSTLENTDPYSLPTRTNFAHNWTVPVNLESPAVLVENYDAGFQMVYTIVKSSGAESSYRIYCVDSLKDTEEQKGVLDTSAHATSNDAYKNRHNFYVDDVDHWIRSTYKNELVLVAKKLLNGTKEEWRMLFVPEAELAEEGVYPVMMLKEHTHAYGNPTITGDVATRSCTTCGYTETVCGQTLQQVTDPTIGETYYLAANQNGTMYYYVTGDVAGTAPYSLKTSTNSGSTQQVTIEDPSAVTGGDGTGFQMTYYTNKTIRIYCYDALSSGENKGIMDTGASAPTSAANATFYVDNVNGVKVLRKTGNNHVLVLKYNDTKSAWRMLGVPETELTNGDVYPVMLLEAHTHDYTSGKPQGDDTNHTEACWCGAKGTKTEAHTYGKSIHNTATKTTTRTCTVCGYTAAVHGHSQAQVKHPEIGVAYNLGANVAGKMMYLIYGTATDTIPYGLRVTEDVTATNQVTLETAPKGVYLTYKNGDTLYRIYCDDTLKNNTVAGQTGIMDTASNTATPTEARHEFEITELNGVRVIRKLVNNNILVVKAVQKKNSTDTELRLLGVPEAELANEGVYPVMLTTANTAHTQHTYEPNWTFDKENGTQSHLCEECGHPKDTLHGTELKASQVTAPAIGSNYYLAANMGGKLYFFRHGTVTDTVPYSLVVTDDFNHNWTMKVTPEDPSALNENLTTPGTHTTGFQLTYINPSSGVLSRIYCMDSLKDATLEGQTGIMDTGVNTSTPYKNRHNFFINETDGSVRSFYKQDHLLVVKQVPQTVSGTTTNVWRMLFVPETDLENEGVYPVMLMNIHEHSFGEEQFSNDEGHYTLCDCETKNLIPHSFGKWTLDRDNQKQTATCSVCDHTVTVASPYFDTVDSLEELENSLAETVLDEETNTYTVSGGKDYYLMAENGDGFYYLRNAGSGENTSSTVSETTGHSLYTTNDPSHDNIIKAKVIPGTENTYIIHAGKAINRVVYIRDEGADGIMDTGMTAFKEASTLTASALATYKARSEFIWDEGNGRLYQLEGDVKYVLVMKQLTNTKTKETEWRIVGVPEAEVNAAGNYPVVLANHVHNLSKNFAEGNGTYYRACGCGYHATVTGNIALGENIGLHFDVKLEAGETVTATVDGETVSVELTENGAKYKAFIPLAAAQMTDEVKLTIGEDALNATFSVRNAANAILADESYNQYAKDLVKNLLSYGAAAQKFFGHNTDDLAGAEVAVTMPTEDTGVQIYNDFEDVAYYGASVIHEGATAVRFYFEAESVEGLTFTVDGNVSEPAQKDSMYYIEVPCGNPQSMDQDINVVVTNGQQNLAVQYSPLTYILRTYNRADASAELKALVQAMYGYHKAAKTYIANMYLGNDFALKSQTKTSLYEGVDQYASTYVAEGDEVKAYTIVISADANVELKVSAGEWSASNTAENPGGTKSVAKHFRDMKNAGNNVLAMINGGFFDLNTGKTMKPYGMQIVDGNVIQAPAAGKYSNNWFGMTKDGKYVISDADGYAAYAEGTDDPIVEGVGGAQMLIVDGKVENIGSDRDFRTAVGVNAKGDLVLVAVENATFKDVSQIFVDLNMDITTVLNLDGGGSTAMYVPGAYYPKALILGEDGLLPREVADAVGIVVKN